MVNGPPCAVCGAAPRREPQGWWCDRCQALTTAEPARAHTPSQPPRFAQTILGQTRPAGFDNLVATSSRTAEAREDASTEHAGATMTGGFAPAATASSSGALPRTAHATGPNPALAATAPSTGYGTGPNPAHATGPDPAIASPYAPGGGASPYAPTPAGTDGVPNPYAGPREASQPYSPIPLDRPPTHAPPPPRRSRKGLVLGLGAGAVAITGIVVAVVALGGSGRSARDALIAQAFASLDDEDKLTKLVDAERVVDQLVDCTANAKRVASDDDSDDIDDTSDASRGERSRTRHLERTAKEVKRAADMARDAKIEVLEILSPPPKPGAFAVRDAADGDTEKARSGADSDDDVIRHPVGKRVFGGCYAKVDHTIQLVRVKVRVTPKDREPFEDRVMLALLHVENGGWHLLVPPRVYTGDSPVVAKARTFRDRMCECKDLDCLESVDKDYDEWRDDAVKADLPEDEEGGLDSVRDDYRTCEHKLETAMKAERGPRAVKQMTALKEEMCKCRDSACAERVKRSATLPDSFDLESDVRKQVNALRDAYYECSVEALASARLSPYDPDLRIEPDIAPACEDYARAMQKLAACAAYPEAARRDLKEAFKTMMNLWKGYSMMRPELQRATVDTCISGRQSTQESMTKFGCS